MIEPYYRDDWVTLYCGDCREILPQLDIKADLCLTDPPYGIGSWTANSTGGFMTDEEAREIAMWDEAPDLLIVLPHCHKAIVWGGNYLTLPPSPKILVWDKQQQGMHFAEAEIAWTNFRDGGTRIFHHGIKSSEIFGRHSERVHPTQKPIILMKWCLENYSEEGNLILDPFAGSGTTLVAAKMLKRKSIGIEISQKYCDIIVNRFNKPIPLFDKPEQLELETSAVHGADS